MFRHLYHSHTWEHSGSWAASYFFRFKPLRLRVVKLNYNEFRMRVRRNHATAEHISTRGGKWWAFTSTCTLFAKETLRMQRSLLMLHCQWRNGVMLTFPKHPKTLCSLLVHVPRCQSSGGWVGYPYPLTNGIWGGEPYWNFILKFHVCNHVFSMINILHHSMSLALAFSSVRLKILKQHMCRDGIPPKNCAAVIIPELSASIF